MGGSFGQFLNALLQGVRPAALTRIGPAQSHGQGRFCWGRREKASTAFADIGSSVVKLSVRCFPRPVSVRSALCRRCADLPTCRTEGRRGGGAHRPSITDARCPAQFPELGSPIREADAPLHGRLQPSATPRPGRSLAGRGQLLLFGFERGPGVRELLGVLRDCAFVDLQLRRAREQTDAVTVEGSRVERIVAPRRIAVEFVLIPLENCGVAVEDRLLIRDFGLEYGDVSVRGCGGARGWRRRQLEGCCRSRSGRHGGSGLFGAGNRMR